MRHDDTPDSAADQLRSNDSASEPFRSSGSGARYEPSGNWGTERRLDQPDNSGPHGMEGAGSGAGYGGFGPEGDYSGAAGEPNADIAGQLNADPDRLIDEAQSLGPVRSDRTTIGRNRSRPDRDEAAVDPAREQDPRPAAHRRDPDDDHTHRTR